jgi:hypothetical protein
MLSFKAMSRAVSEFFVDNKFSSAIETLKAAKTFIRASKVGNCQQCTTMVRSLEDLIQTFDKIKEKRLKYSDKKQHSVNRQYFDNRHYSGIKQYTDKRHHTLVKYTRDKYAKRKKH